MKVNAQKLEGTKIQQNAKPATYTNEQHQRKLSSGVQISRQFVHREWASLQGDRNKMPIGNPSDVLAVTPICIP